MYKINHSRMAAKLKTVFMGTPDFAVAPLLALAGDADIKVVAVITQEDKKTGRKQIITPPPVKTAALKLDIPVLQPSKYRNNNEIVDLLKSLKPDFFVVTAYGQILPEKILKIPRYGSINIHGSLLPKYRGASPIESAIIHGDKETGVTFMKMISKMDAGPIYNIFRIPISNDDTSLTLRKKLSLLAATQLPYVLKDIASGTIQPIEQEHSKATYCRKITKKDGYIDLKKHTATDIINMTRAYYPWPGCFLVFKDKKIKIIRAEKDSNSSDNIKPYEMIEIGKNKIGIGTKKGLLIPLELQMEGKNPVSIQDFLLGNKNLLVKLLESAR